MMYAPTESNMLIRISVYLKVICIFKFHVITIGRANVAADFFTSTEFSGRGVLYLETPILSSDC